MDNHMNMCTTHSPLGKTHLQISTFGQSNFLHFIQVDEHYMLVALLLLISWVNLQVLLGSLEEMVQGKPLFSVW